MTEKKQVPVTTDPIKLSQPAGASLAFMGIEGSIPLWHGVQGCTAFAKILFIQHFREPMPFATTALTHVSVVMGGDGNVIEAVGNVGGSAGVKFIGLHTTGVAETSGVDLKQVAAACRRQYPGLTVAWCATPDYEGSLESGYRKAVEAIIDAATGPKTTTRPGRVALFVGPYVTPGEVEALKTEVERYGLHPVAVPDLGASLLGYVSDAEFLPHSVDGTSLTELAMLADSGLVISVGRGVERPARRFAEAHDIRYESFGSLATLDQLDRFHALLAGVFGRPVPATVRRQRRHLQDTILDAHFTLTGKKAMVAGDPEFIEKWREPLAEIGMEVDFVPAVPHDGRPAGDQKRLREMLTGGELLIGSSHVAKLAGERGHPSVRAGIPVYDRLGEPQSVRLGYSGAAALYREAANALLAHHEERPGYVSELQATLVEARS